MVKFYKCKRVYEIKMRKIGLIVGTFFILTMLAWFLYPRLTLPKYIIAASTMAHKNNVYAVRGDVGEEDIYWNGKIIGIAITKNSKSILVDFFIPQWVREYNDNEHSSISIRAFMGPVLVYDKDLK